MLQVYDNSESLATLQRHVTGLIEQRAKGDLKSKQALATTIKTAAEAAATAAVKARLGGSDAETVFGDDGDDAGGVRYAGEAGGGGGGGGGGAAALRAHTQRVARELQQQARVGCYYFCFGQ
jgi:hypothetical protein